jgi:hypothetical protein
MKGQNITTYGGRWPKRGAMISQFSTRYGTQSRVRDARPFSRLDGFLLSNAGIQPNGMPLTVLSMMARMGADPWDEAECLSSLPNELAVSWLIAAIKRSSLSPQKRCDATMLASHLVNRLHACPNDRQADAALTNGPGIVRVWALMIVFFVVISMFLIIVLS